MLTVILNFRLVGSDSTGIRTNSFIVEHLLLTIDRARHPTVDIQLVVQVSVFGFAT